MFRGYTKRIRNILVTLLIIVTKHLMSIVRKEGSILTLSFREGVVGGSMKWLVTLHPELGRRNINAQITLSSEFLVEPQYREWHSPHSDGISSPHQRCAQSFVSMVILKSSWMDNKDEPPQEETENLSFQFSWGCNKDGYNKESHHLEVLCQYSLAWENSWSSFWQLSCLLKGTCAS